MDYYAYIGMRMGIKTHTPHAKLLLSALSREYHIGSVISPHASRSGRSRILAPQLPLSITFKDCGVWMGYHGNSTLKAICLSDSKNMPTQGLLPIHTK